MACRRTPPSQVTRSDSNDDERRQCNRLIEALELTAAGAFETLLRGGGCGCFVHEHLPGNGLIGDSRREVHDLSVVVATEGDYFPIGDACSGCRLGAVESVEHGRRHRDGFARVERNKHLFVADQFDQPSTVVCDQADGLFLEIADEAGEIACNRRCRRIRRPL